MTEREKIITTGKKLHDQRRRKATSLMINLLIILALCLLAAFFILSSTAREYFAKLGLFTAYNNSVRNVVPPKEIEIPNIEKEFPAKGGRRYPTIRLIYEEGIDDIFAFRWNPNIHAPKGKIQITMNINDEPIGEFRQDIWMTNPDILPGFFRREALDSPQEVNWIIRISESESEEEMLRKIAEASLYPYFEVDFPQDHYNTFPLTNFLGTSYPFVKDKATTKEIESSLYCVFEKVVIKEGNKEILLSETLGNAPSFREGGSYTLNIAGNKKCAGASFIFDIYNIKDGKEEKITPAGFGFDLNSNVQFIHQDPFAILAGKNTEKINAYRAAFLCAQGCNFYYPPISGFKSKEVYFRILS